MVEPDPDAFALAIIELLEDPARLAAMRAAAEHDSHAYSIEAMADNFAQGVTRCLGRS